MNPIVSQYFTKIVTGLDENINLAEAVLHISYNDYPDMDTTKYLLMLDSMASDLASGLANNASGNMVISHINKYLFEDQAFSGNWRNFNDPRNSFLNEVLDRKLGIPISLSLIYIEIAKRLDLSMFGVSFPGHFLVKYKTDERQFIIDPFSGGIILEESELRERLEHFSTDKQSKWDLSKLLQTATNKEIIVRMLRNLKYIYMGIDDHHHALTVCSLHLLLEPDSIDGIRDRARIYDHLECYRAASEGFRRYLALNPQASDYVIIQSRLKDLQYSIDRLH